MTIEVLKPGALTTFQDLGRTGFQHEGVPVSGVMDERSHRIANMLVGNIASEATLEVTWMGPSLAFHAPTVIAVCGAELGATISARVLPLATPVAVAAGDVVSFGKRVSGLRAYLAVAGGYELQPVMGSTSTYVRGGLGGAHGRALQRGDRIEFRKAQNRTPSDTEVSFPDEIQRPRGAPLRIAPGREWAWFAPDACILMAEQAYRISARSDRMGCRLEGPPLLLQHPMELQSEAVNFGTVQVPPDGLPIVLMADRQTTGGYPRIANIAAVDLPRLAQGMAGDAVRFEWITLEEAQRLFVVQHRVFEQMEARHGVN